MKFDYTEDNFYQFPYWFTTNEQVDLNTAMDISQWCGSIFGELGIVWGFAQTTKQLYIGAGKGMRGNISTPVYSWRFKNKEDAMLFKLTWGGE